jgi:hypothetical protein
MEGFEDGLTVGTDAVMDANPGDEPTQGQLFALFQMRSALRRFLSDSSNMCRGVGVTSGQYQLLLAVRAAAAMRPPTMSSLAKMLHAGRVRSYRWLTARRRPRWSAGCGT